MVNVAEVKCMSKELKDVLIKRFTNYRSFGADIDSFFAGLGSVKECDSNDKKDVKIKRSKKPKTERNVYMGVCMRGADKGGMGKDMKTCSENFKGMSNEEKNKYKPKEA